MKKLCLVLAIIYCLALLPVGALASESSDEPAVGEELAILQIAGDAADETTEAADEAAGDTADAEYPDAEEPAADEAETDTTPASDEPLQEETPEPSGEADETPELDGSGSCGEDATYTWENGVLTITGTGAIYSDAFFGYEMSSVVIGEGITSIGLAAFGDCGYLETVSLPESLTEIGGHAFAFCSSLTEVILPEGLEKIGSYAFFGCTSLTNIVIPESVTSIGSDAFRDTPWFENQTEEFVVVNGMLMEYNGTDVDVVIPDNVTSIGTAFEGTNIESVTIPASVTSISDYAFAFCDSLKSVSLPSTVTEIGEGAFMGCQSLTQIALPKALTTIGARAFMDSGLTTVNIPAGVTQIGEAAFSYTPWASSQGSFVIVNGILIAYNPSGSAEKYVTIPNSVTAIGDGAFQFSSDIVGVTIPSTVTKIGARAFMLCQSLESVTVPDSVTSIGVGAFQLCGSLKSVTLPASVSRVSDLAFANCEELQSVSMPGATTIGSAAFMGCASLASISIPKTVTAIEYEAFSYCSHLASVEIPTSVTSIGYSAFEGCSALGEITIPSSVTEVEYGSFMSCTNLAAVSIPKSVSSIADRGFYNCSSIADVYYSSTEADWNTVTVGVENDDLLNATFHFLDPAEHTHVWNEPAFEWAHEYETCTATFVCADCGLTETVDCAISSSEEAYFLATATHHGETFTNAAEFTIDLSTDIHIIGSDVTIVIYCSVPLKYFVSAEMDGVLVPEQYYTLADGSTVLTFDSSYLDTLTVGEHTVTLNYEINGRALKLDTTITIISHTINFVVHMVDQSGNVLANLSLSMHSTPKYATTDSSGNAAFNELEFGSHTMYVLDANGNEKASQKIEIVSGNSTSINGNVITAKAGSTVQFSMQYDGSKLSFVSNQQGTTGGTATTTGAPKTGDDSHPAVYAAILAVSTLSVGAVCVIWKRRKNELS